MNLTPIQTPFDPGQCPLCRQPNNCQLWTLSARKGPCWCARVETPEALLARVPAELRDRACICRSCIESFRRQPAKVQRCRAFTLTELVTVIAVISILAALLVPVLGKGKMSAQQADCVSNLRQLGIATQLYWDENSEYCFNWIYGATNDGVIYWFGWLHNDDLPEGQRPFDLSQGVLFPYLNGGDVRLCPTLYSTPAQLKLKGDGDVFSYGYNFYLSAPMTKPSVSANKIKNPSNLAVFADSAQINDFQDPASPANPMLEEWYYLDLQTNYSSANTYPNGHFRHSQKANAVFCDGHVDSERFVTGSIDPKLPSQFVGQLRPEILLIP